MKTLQVVTAMASVLGILCGCDDARQETLRQKPEGKILVVCYSESANRNTLTAAEWIHQQVGGDLLTIRMSAPYSDSYRKVLKESKYHMDNNIKPEILPFDKEISDYDVIFIGSPVWYGTFAPPVGTFLSMNEMSGKTLVPFCTHGGGGAGTLFEDIAQAAPGAKILPGLALKGSNVIERTIGRGTAEKASPDEVIRWLNEILK